MYISMTAFNPAYAKNALSQDESGSRAEAKKKIRIVFIRIIEHSSDRNAGSWLHRTYQMACLTRGCYRITPPDMISNSPTRYIDKGFHLIINKLEEISVLVY